MTRFGKAWLGIAATTVALAIGGGQALAQKELVFGFQCDRTGPTANVGVNLCPGYHDYIALVNSKGGVEGYKIKVIEVDNEYRCRRPWRRTSASRRRGPWSRACSARRRLRR